MNKPSETTEKPILLSLADRLTEAQREVDELTVQLALGKADVKEKYEEIKKEFNYRLASFKNAILNQKHPITSGEIVRKIELLEERLTIGKAESKEMFAAQRKFIMKAMGALEQEVKKMFPVSLDAQYLSHEMDSFKLKMEILRLRLILKRFALKEELKSDSVELRIKVSGLIEKARKKVSLGEKKVIQLNKDIRQVFS